MKCSMYAGATTSPPRCTWRWKPSSGFTHWFGGWERGWLRNASGLAMKKCCGSAMQPEIYAESILKTCEFCVASPLACVSGVTGADLKQRIVRIMTQRSVDKLGFLKKSLLVAIGTGAVAAPIVAGLIKAPVATAQAYRDSAPATVQSDSNTFADAQQIYHVGGDVSAPKLVFAPDPEFTEKARRAKYQGVCVISTVDRRQGNPTQVQVVRHLGMGLDKKAVEAVKQYRFTPAMRLGNPLQWK